MNGRSELGQPPELATLVGLRLSIIRRAVDMLILHFGSLREIESRKPGLAQVGEIAVHISGPWRIDGPTQTLVGRQDLFRFDGVKEPSGWSSEQGNTALDAELDAGFGRNSERKVWFVQGVGFEVVSTIASRYGDLEIQFANGFGVRAFPDSTGDECWRLFVPRGNSDHLVVPDYDD